MAFTSEWSITVARYLITIWLMLYKLIWDAVIVMNLETNLWTRNDICLTAYTVQSLPVYDFLFMPTWRHELNYPKFNLISKSVLMHLRFQTDCQTAHFCCPAKSVLGCFRFYTVIIIFIWYFAASLANNYNWILYGNWFGSVSVAINSGKDLKTWDYRQGVIFTADKFKRISWLPISFNFRYSAWNFITMPGYLPTSISLFIFSLLRPI